MSPIDQVDRVIEAALSKLDIRDDPENYLIAKVTAFGYTAGFVNISYFSVLFRLIPSWTTVHHESVELLWTMTSAR